MREDLLSRTVGVLLLLAFLGTRSSAWCQSSSAPTSKELRAARVADGRIHIDGHLNETAWATVKAGTDFTQRDPSDGTPASERTEVRVLYSESAIYVGVRAFDSEPRRIISEVARRDRTVQADEISVFFDSYFDRRTAFEFAVNPSGAIRDVYYQDEYTSDISWDPVWEVVTSVDSAGWTAEYRIPLTQLRYDRRGNRWGFQVMRRVQRKSERAYWMPYSKKTSGLASRFGTLTGLDSLSQPVRLELRPYTVSSRRTRKASSVGSYAPPVDTRLSGGGDVKLGLTSNLTLDVTVNPDFGQVEADPSVVNLSAFESYFPEKRPFFVEGSGLFGTYVQQGQVFYSRRIGRSPQSGAAPPPNGSVEIPDQTRIIGAAKLTGKKVRGFNVGLVSVMTAQEKALLRDSAGNVSGDSPVEPLTHYLVGRLEKDFRNGSNTVGAMITGVNRKLTPELRFLRSSSYVGVADGVHRWANGTYALRWNIAGSDIRGSRAAITAAQRSSFRYYQRPDARHTDLDTSRTELSGWTATANFGKETGTWTYWGLASQTSPGFDVNDLGFQFGGDNRDLRVGAGYNHTRPKGVFRDYQISATGWRRWTTGGELIETFFPFVYVGATFKNNWTLMANPMNVDFSRRCITCLRGGPSLRTDPFHAHFLRITTDRRRNIAFGMEGYWNAAFTTGPRAGSVAQTLYWKASETLNGSVTTRYSPSDDPYQYVTARRALDSTRYVLGEIHQKTVYLTNRLNWTVNPKLSFEFYAQPFVSSGSYDNFKQVVDPAAKSLANRFSPLPGFTCGNTGVCSTDYNADGVAEFSFGRPDFRFLQLRSTAVLRWEYRPGSVLFVAWQHGRTGSESNPTFSGFGDFPDILKIRPDNTVLVKANYWVNF
ncbi:MAG: DUF5916 domain-containing protein [Gemmatimonadaceae bacterium]|nr:DUF5916 domain-containing protein [Gemmatimonadaceae bacterium]